MNNLIKLGIVFFFASQTMAQNKLTDLILTETPEKKLNTNDKKGQKFLNENKRKRFTVRPIKYQRTH